MSEKRVAPAVFQWAVVPVVLSGAVVWALDAIWAGVSAPTAILAPQFASFVLSVGVAIGGWRSSPW